MDRPLHYETDGDVLTIAINAEVILDQALILQLEQELLGLLDSAMERKVLLDLGQVKFMATLAIGLILRARIRCRDSGIRLRLCSIGPDIREVFQVTRLDTIFEISPDAATARAAFLK